MCVCTILLVHMSASAATYLHAVVHMAAREVCGGCDDGCHLGLSRQHRLARDHAAHNHRFKVVLSKNRGATTAHKPTQQHMRASWFSSTLRERESVCVYVACVCCVCMGACGEECVFGHSMKRTIASFWDTDTVSVMVNSSAGFDASGVPMRQAGSCRIQN